MCSGPSRTLCGRVIAALKSNALLNESIGAGYLDRNWPPALKQSGAWPLKGLRQSFLNGTLTRLLDADAALRGKIVDFVSRGEFGLGSGQRPEGTFNHLWYDELVPADEVSFEPDVFLVTKAKAKSLKAPPKTKKEGEAESEPVEETEPQTEETTETKKPEPEPKPTTRTFRLTGTIPSELWNRLGTKLIPKLRSGADLRVGVTFSVTFDAEAAKSMKTEIRQVLQDSGLQERIVIE